MRFSPLVSFFNCMYTIWKCNLFFTFILYLMTLLNPLIGSSSSVCVCVCVCVFLRLFYIELLLGNKDGSSSLPMWIPFIYFPCLTVLAGTASRILKRRGDTGHPALFLILGGINVCLFTIMLVISNRFSVDALCQVEEFPFYSYYAESFIMHVIFLSNTVFLYLQIFLSFVLLT